MSLTEFLQTVRARDVIDHRGTLEMLGPSESWKNDVMIAVSGDRR